MTKIFSGLVLVILLCIGSITNVSASPLKNSGYSLTNVYVVLDKFINKFANHQAINEQIKCIVHKHPVSFITNQEVVQLFELLSCGGGNHVEQYMIPISVIGGVWTLGEIWLVGSDMGFTANKLETNQGIIILTGLYLQDSDAHCCPTQHSVYKYRLVHNIITRVK